MSLQWTFIAVFLYTEIFLCILLMLPFISPQTWQKIFRSRLLNAFRSYANLYFNVFIAVLLILFVDAIRDVRKYSTPLDDKEILTSPQAESALHMKLFRAQRNFYIAGLALFLFLVMRKLVTLISNRATLEAEASAAKKQAESATAAAKQFMEDKDNKANEIGNEAVQELEKKSSEVAKLKQELQHAQKDREAMQRQAESTKTEYDRVSGELQKLELKLRTVEGTQEAKKDA